MSKPIDALSRTAMRYLSDKVSQPASTLIVMLPGANHQPEGFIEEGFVRAVRERQLAVDLSMVELPFSHIADASAIDALHQHIMLPAIAAGYQQLWIAGISIGGYMAMAYANRYPGVLTGMSLLAPYPGNRMTTNEIASAGGLTRWAPGHIAEDDVERHNWQWLQAHYATGPKIYLGYGEQDRFAHGHTMMAAVLPASRVTAIPGDHVWPVWLSLWQQFLDQEFELTHA
jgi:hypothetical protein